MPFEIQELEESGLNEDDDGYDGDENDTDDEDDGTTDVDETEEEVEILVSFEENGQEYHLVRLLDPVLLVGKVSAFVRTRKILISYTSNLLYYFKFYGFPQISTFTSQINYLNALKYVGWK